MLEDTRTAVTVVRLDGITAILARQPDGHEALIAQRVVGSGFKSPGALGDIVCERITPLEEGSFGVARSEVTSSINGYTFKRVLTATPGEIVDGFKAAGLRRPSIVPHGRVAAMYDKLRYHTLGMI